MKTSTIVGGNWGDNPKASKIIDKIREEIHFDDVYNGGAIEDLPKYPKGDLVVWMPNIENEHEKSYPVKEKGAVLICSKVMRDGYKETDAISRIFKMGGNAVIAIYPYTLTANQDSVITKINYTFQLIDALGNTWYKGQNIEFLCAYIFQLYEFTKLSIRIPTVQSTKEVKFEYDKELLSSFIQMNRSLAKNIQIGCGERFFGNLSTRCQKLFPTMRSETAILVSPRNINKEAIEPEDMVLAYRNDYTINEIKYNGERKPSVDTPTQLLIYHECDYVNFMIHGHAFIKDVVTTEDYYLCGDIREADEVMDIMEDIRMHGGNLYGAINLKNHGFLIYADTLDNMKKVIDQCVFTYERTPDETLNTTLQ